MGEERMERDIFPEVFKYCVFSIAREGEPL